MTEQTGADPTVEDRLDGWKRIAAYLSRDVRTVRRWEKNEGLPVRRLMHDRQATVYAFRGELDTWLEQRGAEGPARRGGAWSHVAGGLRDRWAWVAVPALVAGGLLAWLWPHGEEPELAFGQWDWVLVTEFDNRTGEQVLDGTIEYAMRTALANSRYVKVAPPERVIDTLRLMKLPLDTSIDIETGREISLRDGDIRMMIGGRIEKIGGNYLVSVELVNPGDGVTLRTHTAEAGSLERILPVIGELSLNVRSTLGEGLASIDASENVLARVTTPSLEALQLFTEANRIMAGTERNRALALLQEAVRIDTDFASAHLLLSYALGDRDEPERSSHHLQRAVELAEQASERERLFILATYYHAHLEDIPKAIDTYHLLLRLYPDHFWAAGNLAATYELTGRFDLSLDLRLQSADLRPNLGYLQWDVAVLAAATGDDANAARYAQRAMALANDNPWLRVNLKMLPVYQVWSRGDYPGTLEELDSMVAGLDPGALAADDWLSAHVRSLYLALGALDRFRELSSERPRVGWLQALLDYDSGNVATMEDYLDEQDRGYWNATLAAMAGDSGRARLMIDDPRSVEFVPPPHFVGAWINLARGHLALAENRPGDAVERLDDWQLRLKFMVSDRAAMLLALNALARAYERLGQSERAIETLEQARLQKSLTVFEPGATYMWQRNQLYLHQLYSRAGLTTAAEAVDAELREMLELAQPDHPVHLALGTRSADPRATASE